MKLTRVGVDLAKQVFQVHGVDRAERPIWCQRLKRVRWIGELERNAEPFVPQPPTLRSLQSRGQIDKEQFDCRVAPPGSIDRPEVP